MRGDGMPESLMLNHVPLRAILLIANTPRRVRNQAGLRRSADENFESYIGEEKNRGAAAARQ